MRVNDLFQSLSYGELSTLALSNGGNGTIVAAKHAKLMIYINDGLLALYSRFPLRESEVIIQLQEATQFYHLLEKYAVSKGEVTDPYIVDTPGKPFVEDVIRINSVYSVYGSKLGLNDANDPNSVFTPQVHVLQVPDHLRADPAIGETQLSIQYQANHEKITSLEQSILLPLCLQGALASFVAYKVFSHMGSDGSSMKAAEHLGNYEAACNAAEQNDLVLATVSQTNSRFANNGWV